MEEFFNSENVFNLLEVGILAGGKSERMGRNKALLRLENERIIERLIREFGSFSRAMVSSAEKGIYEELGVSVVYDENRDIGPIEGIRRVLSEADSEYVFICAADMPFLKKEIAEYLACFISSDYDCYVMADDEHIQPLCAIYKKSLLPLIGELIRDGKYRIRELLKRARTKYIPLSLSGFDKNTVRNINTKEDYLEIIKPFVFCVSGYSGSGKTWLIEKLINEFKNDGYSVAVIKHDGHDSFSDIPESDTGRLFKAGAVSTGIFSDKRYSFHVRERLGAEDMVNKLKGAESPPDVVIIEGLKDSGYPKVELIRKGIHEKSVCKPDSLICIATDCLSPNEVSCPVFGLDDSRGIFLCIRDYFLSLVW